MTEQEKQLVIKVAKFILVKTMNDRVGMINCNEIAKETNVPVGIIHSAAKYICKCLMKSQRVDDVDFVDREYFDIMLKRNIIKTMP